MLGFGEMPTGKEVGKRRWNMDEGGGTDSCEDRHVIKTFSSGASPRIPS